MSVRKNQSKYQNMYGFLCHSNLNSFLWTDKAKKMTFKVDSSLRMQNLLAHRIWLLNFLSIFNFSLQHSGFDRGHLAAAANHRMNQNLCDETFLLSNMAPQVHTYLRKICWIFLVIFRVVGIKSHEIEMTLITIFQKFRAVSILKPFILWWFMEYSFSNFMNRIKINMWFLNWDSFSLAH